jgi:arylsulfatase A-like enzyme
LARRLIEAGVRLVCVNAFTGLTANSPPTLPQVWDMHGGQYGSIFGTGGWGLGFALPRADAAVSTLLEDLEVRGLSERTLVVMVGEFGRTPAISGSPPGRDHHAPCYSAMLAGAGIRGGAVYGASDRFGGEVKDRPVSLEDFSATMYHALGLPPDTGLSRPDGFTQHISNGRPVAELFG